MNIDPLHLAKVRNKLASDGIEYTPDQLTETIDIVFTKMQQHLKEQGWDATKEEIRDFLHENRERLLNPTFMCTDCGQTFPYDPNDPASGGICAECAQRAFDECPDMELTPEELAACKNFDIEALLKRINEKEKS